MTNMEQQRLRRLVEGLKTLKPCELRMHNWSNRQDETTDPYDCGTVACAAGWTPRFLPELVKWNRYDDLNVKGRNLYPMTAMMSLFGLTEAQAMYLFDSHGTNYYFRDYSPDPLADVIARCEWLLGNPKEYNPFEVEAPEGVER